MLFPRSNDKLENRRASNYRNCPCKKYDMQFTVAYHACGSEAMDQAGKSKTEMAAGESEVEKGNGSFEIKTK